jgi:hypothetical protein
MRAPFASRLTVLLAALAFACGQAPIRGGTIDLYLVTGVQDTFPPDQVDALAFANYGTFWVDTGFSTLPYDFQNTRHFTNGGTMIGSPGFQIDTAFSTGIRQPAEHFVNEAGASVSVGNSLLISAQRLENQGGFTAGGSALVRLKGGRMDLSRGTINIASFGGIGQGDFVTTNGFFPDVAIQDYWWGGPADMSFGLSDFYRLDPIVGPVVNVPAYVVTNFNGFETTDAFGFAAQVSSVYTNEVTPTNWTVQAVFVAYNTNLLNGQARFSAFNSQTGMRTPAVRLSMISTNSVTGATIIDNLYLSDGLASRTNRDVLVNLQTGFTYRPANYRVSRLELTDYGLGTGGNTQVRSNLFSDPSFESNTAESEYTAYVPWLFTPVDTGTVPNVPEATVSNLAGRLEIEAQSLNLSRARMRANGLLSIQAGHVEDTTGAQFESGAYIFDLASTNGTLRLDAKVAFSSRTFDGPVRLWSALWTNFTSMLETNIEVGPEDPPVTTTNIMTNMIEILFHAFVVDGRFLGSTTTEEAPGHSFILRSTNVVIADNYRVVGKLLIDAIGLENRSNFVFQGGNGRFAASNAPSLLYLTNHGTMTIGNAATFGADRAVPYRRFVNRGTLNASALLLRSEQVDIGGRMNISGFYQIQTGVGKFENGFSQAANDMVLAGGDLKFHRYTNGTTGTLVVNATNSFSDSGGTTGASQFSCSRGFIMMRKPTYGDLLGSRVVTASSANAVVSHWWAAEDRGLEVVGFRDNMAIGRLVLSSALNGMLRFQAPEAGRKSAIYVDYLDLQGFVLNAYNRDALGDYLQIDPDVTIYFAYANVPVEALDGRLNGRLRWVKDFAGPNSSVLVALPSGRTVAVNRGLRESLIIDSDGDGLANGYDPTPFPDTYLEATVSQVSPTRTLVRWMAAPLTSYELEYSTQIGGEWHSLTTVTNSETEPREVEVEDEVGSAGATRYYRVRYNP